MQIVGKSTSVGAKLKFVNAILSAMLEVKLSKKEKERAEQAEERSQTWWAGKKTKRDVFKEINPRCGRNSLQRRTKAKRRRVEVVAGGKGKDLASLN